MGLIFHIPGIDISMDGEARFKQQRDEEQFSSLICYRQSFIICLFTTKQLDFAFEPNIFLNSIRFIYHTMLINLPFAKLTLILAAVVASVPACAAVGSSGSNDEERQVFPRLRTIQTRQQISSSAAEKTGAPQQISSSVPEKTEAPQQDTVEILMEQMLLMSMDTTIDPTTDLPSAPPSDSPTESPTGSPTELVTMGPTTAATALATGAPSVVASEPIITTLAPTQGDATVIDTEIPSVTPSLRPTDAPTGTPPTLTPTVEGCGISADVRRQQILALLDSVADPDLIRDDSTTLGQATTWLLENDPRKICPGVPKILQRWVLAVLYFSTGGDEWFQCSANLLADDPCGFEEPFASPQKQRFLSGFNECEWAGITCDEELCVTEIEFGMSLWELSVDRFQRIFDCSWSFTDCSFLPETYMPPFMLTTHRAE